MAKRINVVFESNGKDFTIKGVEHSKKTVRYTNFDSFLLWCLDNDISCGYILVPDPYDYVLCNHGSKVLEVEGFLQKFNVVYGRELNLIYEMS